MKFLIHLWSQIVHWRYKYRNCENCPASHAGYESHDFDSCDIYGDDFKYEYCKYIWLPRWFVVRKAREVVEQEAAQWIAYAEAFENEAALAVKKGSEQE